MACDVAVDERGVCSTTLRVYGYVTKEVSCIGAKAADGAESRDSVRGFSGTQVPLNPRILKLDSG